MNQELDTSVIPKEADSLLHKTDEPSVTNKKSKNYKSFMKWKKKKDAKTKSSKKAAPEKNKSNVSDVRTYLLKFESDKANWKFNKLRQIELLECLFDKEKCDKDLFKVAVRYLKGLKGESRTRILEDCKLRLASDKSSKRIKKRSKDLIAHLGESDANID